jgi:hypothetical protein
MVRYRLLFSGNSYPQMTVSMTVTLLTTTGVTVIPLTDSGGLYLLITPKGGKW